MLACAGDLSATANKWPLRYAYNRSALTRSGVLRGHPLTRSGLALASRFVPISYVLNCVVLRNIHPCVPSGDGRAAALLWRDGPPSVLAPCSERYRQRWMPPQIKAWVFCVKAPPPVEFCGLTTENRAGPLVDGGRIGAGLSRVGLHPDCGFRDPCASRRARVPNPSKRS